MRARSIILFLIGLLLALLAYPFAWFVSLGLAYVFAIIALILGVYIAVKRASTAELVLGVVLAAFAILILAGTAVTHVAVVGVEKAVKEVTEVKSITAGIGERVSAGSWAITVLSVKTPSYIKIGDTYYMPSEGMKFVVIRLKIENIGKEIKDISDIWNFMLITDTGKVYERKYYPGRWVFKVTSEVQAKALTITELKMTQKLAPGGSIEGDVMFEITVNENPVELRYKVGIVGGYEVIVKLT